MRRVKNGTDLSGSQRARHHRTPLLPGNAALLCTPQLRELLDTAPRRQCDRRRSRHSRLACRGRGTTRRRLREIRHTAYAKYSSAWARTRRRSARTSGRGSRPGHVVVIDVDGADRRLHRRVGDPTPTTSTTSRSESGAPGPEARRTLIDAPRRRRAARARRDPALSQRRRSARTFRSMPRIGFVETRRATKGPLEKPGYDALGSIRRRDHPVASRIDRARRIAGASSIDHKRLCSAACLPCLPKAWLHSRSGTARTGYRVGRALRRPGSFCLAVEIDVENRRMSTSASRAAHCSVEHGHNLHVASRAQHRYPNSISTYHRIVLGEQNPQTEQSVGASMSLLQGGVRRPDREFGGCPRVPIDADGLCGVEDRLERAATTIVIAFTLPKCDGLR